MTQEAAQPADIRALAEYFADLAGSVDVASGERPLDRIVAIAARALPGGKHAALTEIHGSGPPTTGASSDELPRRVDALQYRLREGPCLQAIECNDVCYTGDLLIDPTWPRFGPAAVRETGVRSMLSYRMFVGPRHRAALNFYATAVDAFDDDAVAVGAILAAYCSLALVAEKRGGQVEHLQRALAASREIGMAMGILMTRDQLTEEQAFAQLRAASQTLNRKLRDVAAEVATSSEPHALRVIDGPDRVGGSPDG
ncbi:MAG: GAF and ANTAR domain-containing protein [Mycobacteriales bacterium]